MKKMLEHGCIALGAPRARHEMSVAEAETAISETIE
jgi:hypothetical protein